MVSGGLWTGSADHLVSHGPFVAICAGTGGTYAHCSHYVSIWTQLQAKYTDAKANDGSWVPSPAHQHPHLPWHSSCEDLTVVMPAWGMPR